MKKIKTNLYRGKECPYCHDICTSNTCPEGCKLPRTCVTCGYEPCANFDGGHFGDDEMGCWIAPYYWNKGDTPERYWPYNTDDDDFGVA